MTERKSERTNELKRELDNLTVKFDRIISHTDNLIFSFDYVTKENEWFGAIKRLTGYNKSEFARIYRKKWKEMIHEDDFDSMMKTLEKAMKSGGKYKTSYRFLRKDKKWAFFEEEGVAIRNNKKNIFRIVGSIRDVTERNKMANTLKENEEKYRYFLVNSSEGIYRISLRKKVNLNIDPIKAFELIRKHEYIADCNDNLAKMYGYKKREDIIGKSPYEFHTHVREVKKQHFKKADVKKKIKEYIENMKQTKFTRQDALTIEYDRYGNKKYFLNNVVGMFDGDYLLGFWGSQRDVTKLKESEDIAIMREKQLIESDKLATLGTLATGIAHEINNPNNFIMLNAQIMKTAWNDLEPILKKHYEKNGDFMLGGLPYSKSFQELAKMIDGVEQGSIRIKNIISGLKEFAIKSDKKREIVDVNSVIDSALIITGNMIKKCAKNFEFIRGGSIPSVYANKQQLEQVVINLLTNACQAMKGREGFVRIKTSSSRQRERVYVTVEDDGVGISKENLKHILDPFFTTKRDLGGTGLGLSITHSILKEHNASIEFKSDVGKGTRVKVSFPASGGDSDEKY
ncbi:MAG: ATP-binding protein [bacterium]|nr:ATP-binding protein [bacterium]